MLRLAKQGDEKAIASVLNYLCQDRDFQISEVTLNHGCLRIVLESREIGDRHSCVTLLHQVVTDLGIESAKSLMICARQPGKYTPVWSETIALINPREPESYPTIDSENSQEMIHSKLQRWLAKFPLPSLILGKEWENQEKKPQKVK